MLWRTGKHFKSLLDAIFSYGAVAPQTFLPVVIVEDKDRASAHRKFPCPLLAGARVHMHHDELDCARVSRWNLTYSESDLVARCSTKDIREVHNRQRGSWRGWNRSG